jgi:hypothetical protein
MNAVRAINDYRVFINLIKGSLKMEKIINKNTPTRKNRFFDSEFFSQLIIPSLIGLTFYFSIFFTGKIFNHYVEIGKVSYWTGAGYSELRLLAPYSDNELLLLDKITLDNEVTYSEFYDFEDLREENWRLNLMTDLKTLNK